MDEAKMRNELLKIQVDCPQKTEMFHSLLKWHLNNQLNKQKEVLTVLQGVYLKNWYFI